MAKRQFSVFRNISMALEAGFILPFVYFLSLFPFEKLFGISKSIGFFLFKISPPKKQEILENLKVINPQKSWSNRELDQIGSVLMGYPLRIFVETIKLGRMGFQDRVSYMRILHPQVFAYGYRLQQEKIPVIFITLHAGNWEFYGQLMNDLGFRMASVVERQFNPILDKHFQYLRRKIGIIPIYNEISQLKPIIQHLKSGDSVALVADQNHWFDPVFIDFFGREAAAPKGIANLILRTQAQLMYGASFYYGQGKYLFESFVPEYFEFSDNKEQNVIDIMTFVYRYFESVILKDLSNWYSLGFSRWNLTRESLAEWKKNPDSDPW